MQGPARVVNVRDDVSTASDGLLAGLAIPDAGGVALDGDLAAECAGVAAVLLDFDLLDLLTEGGTVAVFILSARSSHHSCHSSYLGVIVDVEEGASREYSVPSTVFTGNSDL